jgi:hypothetical protein
MNRRVSGRTVFANTVVPKKATTAWRTWAMTKEQKILALADLIRDIVVGAIMLATVCAGYGVLEYVWGW